MVHSPPPVAVSTGGPPPSTAAVIAASAATDDPGAELGQATPSPRTPCQPLRQRSTDEARMNAEHTRTPLSSTSPASISVSPATPAFAAARPTRTRPADRRDSRTP